MSFFLISRMSLIFNYLFNIIWLIWIGVIILILLLAENLIMFVSWVIRMLFISQCLFWFILICDYSILLLIDLVEILVLFDLIDSIWLCDLLWVIYFWLFKIVKLLNLLNFVNQYLRWLAYFINHSILLVFIIIFIILIAT